MADGPVMRYDTDGGSEVVPERPRTKAELLKEAALAVPHLTVLLGRLLRDSDVPLRRKLFAGGALAYIVSPYDVLPDFIPLVGRIDDIVLLAASIHYLIASVPAEKVESYWEGSEDALDIVSGIIEWGADLIPAPVRNLLNW